MDINQRKQWLINLKPGDEVAVTRGLGIYHIYKVKSLTPTGFVNVESGSGTIYKYKPDGTRKLSTCYYERIYPVTEEIRDKIKRSALLYNIRNTDYQCFNTDTLEKIHALIVTEQEAKQLAAERAEGQVSKENRTEVIDNINNTEEKEICQCGYDYDNCKCIEFG